MEKLSKEAKSRLRANGMSFNTDEKKKAKSWNLIWTYCGKDNVISSANPYAVCRGLQNKKSKEPNYKRGIFTIKPNY